LGNRFYYQGAPSARQFAALLADTILLTALFVTAGWLGTHLGRSRPGELLRDLTLLCFLVVPANAIRGLFQLDAAGLTLEYWRHAGVHGFSPVAQNLLGCGASGLLAMVVRFHRSLARTVYRVLALLFPLVLLLVVEACGLTLWGLAHPAVEGQRVRLQNPPVPIPAETRPQRVVWIIFDEMDYRLAFATPVNARLPEFNRLAAGSFHAVCAYPPGGRTMISVPALLTGRLVTNSTAADASGLRVQYEGAAGPSRWTVKDTIFNLQREKGWRTAVAGWYFPYARIFGQDIDAWQYQGWHLALNPDRPFAGLMSDQLRVLAEGKSQSLLGRALSAQEHKRIVREVVAEASRKAADPTLDLVFLHLPLPHAPFFYDARTGGDAWPPRPVLGYFDHLLLGDQALGQIRREMQHGGVGDKTVLLVSSDHWNRQSDLVDGKMDHRVPFLVYFPASPAGLEYRAAFNTILSRRLVTAILKGEVHNPAEAAAWIGREVE
jgi:hypothetical protein